MAIKIGSNFAYNGKLPNFERDSFETKAAMKAFDENSIDEGHISYCKEDGNIYQYKHTNTVNTTTGRWRIFKTDIVVDAALNGTSTNPIQNKAVLERINRERNYSNVLYQPKYKADFIFDKDYKYSELQENYNNIDLNGYILTIDVSNTTTKNFYNGTISVVVGDVKFDSFEIKNCFIHQYSNFRVECGETSFYNCDIEGIIIDSSGGEFYNCTIVNCIFIAIPIIQYSEIISPTINISENTNVGMRNVIINGEIYKNTNVKNNNFVEIGYESNIDNPTTPGNAPSCEAVKGALQLKADKTQLNNYVTTTTANSTYAKKSDITNIYKFKGTKTNYDDLHTIDRVTGDVWNITNADAEHGIKAGDNVAWNGTEWDNLSGTVDLSAYATTATTDAMSADIKKLMDKAFPFTVNVSIDKTLAKKGTSQPVKVTITPKIGDDNTEVDAIMINGGEHHGAIPYVYSDTATTTTTYNVRADKDSRSARGSATITFVNPSYDGVVAANFTATEANIKALTETLRSGKSGTRTFNLNNQKACIAYPKAFGAATGIKDANGFDYLASYTRSELNVNGELYYVYLLTNATTITDMKQTIS